MSSRKGVIGVLITRKMSTRKHKKVEKSHVTTSLLNINL